MGRRATIAGQLVNLENQLKMTERDTLEFTTLQQRVAAMDASQQLYVQKRRRRRSQRRWMRGVC